VARQGGDPKVVDDYDRLPAAPQRHTVSADRRGYVTDLHAERIGRAAMVLGAGRERADAGVDHAVGIELQAGVGAPIKPGEPLLELHYRDASRLGPALQILQRSWTIEDAPPTLLPQVLESIGGE